MAPRPKTQWPHPLVEGGCRAARICAAALALMAVPLAAASAQSSAPAGLATGAAALSAGKYENAVRQLTAALNSDKIGTSDTARAFYLRGIAYQKLNQPGRAISDLGAAIWLGLPSADKTQAQVTRALAYRAAGLDAQAQADIASAREGDSGGNVDRLVSENGGSASDSAASVSSAIRGEERTADASPGWDTSVAGSNGEQIATSAPPPQPEQGGGSRWTSWMPSMPSWGGHSSSAPSPAPEAAPPPEAANTVSVASAEPEARQPPAKATSDWSTQTQVVTADARPDAGAGGGSYKLQLAASRSEDDAQALWKKVATSNPQLASSQPLIEKTEMGNLGTFYRLQIGPFTDKAESLKLCNALKRSGIDCFLVAR